MEKLGGSGRGSLWYGDELSVLRGRLTGEGESLPEHERTDIPFQDPMRRKGTFKKTVALETGSLREVLKDPLIARTPAQAERLWAIANGIYVED